MKEHAISWFGLQGGFEKFECVVSHPECRVW